MKKILTGIGVAIGVVIGIVFLFLPVEALPAFVTNTTRSIAVVLRRILMPNEDPMGAFLIEIPVLVVITGMIGGQPACRQDKCGWGGDANRRRRRKHQQPNPCDSKCGAPCFNA